MADKVTLVMADKDAEREAFEAWCVTQGWVEKPKARPNGTYVNGALQARWIGWWARACRDTSAGVRVPASEHPMLKPFADPEANALFAEVLDKGKGSDGVPGTDGGQR